LFFVNLSLYPLQTSQLLHASESHCRRYASVILVLKLAYFVLDIFTFKNSMLYHSASHM